MFNYIMEAIIDKVKENRPHLSAGSIKTYKSILKNIYDKCYDDKEYCFKKFDDDSVILDHLKDIAFNKRKTVLAGLSVLTGNPAYQKVMMHDIHEYNAEQLKQEKTPAQEEGMIEPEEVMSIFQVLDANAKHCLKKQSISPSDLVEIQKWVMLALTGGIFQPPRRSVDFGMMKFRNYDKEKDNYIDIKNSKFVFQNYKTAKTYGMQDLIRLSASGAGHQPGEHSGASFGVCAVRLERDHTRLHPDPGALPGDAACADGFSAAGLLAHAGYCPECDAADVCAAGIRDDDVRLGESAPDVRRRHGRIAGVGHGSLRR